MQHMTHCTDFKGVVFHPRCCCSTGGGGGGWYACINMRLFKHFEAWLLVLSASQELNILLTRELDDVESKLNCADWGKLQGGRTLGYRGTLRTLLAFSLSLYVYVWILLLVPLGPFCSFL